MKLTDFLILLVVGIALAAIGLVVITQPTCRASNERSFSASLKTLTTAEMDFRANDRDGNRVRDFWTGDVFALYGLIPITPGSTTPPANSTHATDIILLIQPSLAAADGASQTSLYGHVDIAASIVNGSTKAGYICRRFDSEENGTGAASISLLNDTDGAGAFYGPVHDLNRFAFVAFPETLSAGKVLFFVNESSVIWRIDLPTSYSATYTPLTQGAESAGSITGTGHPRLESWTFPAHPETMGAKKME